jgi:hypothetical protein
MMQPVHQRDGAGQQVGRGHVERRRTPDDLHPLVEEQDDAEGGQHLLQVIPLVEVAEDDKLQGQAEQHGGRQRQRQRQQHAAGKLVARHRQVRAQHVLHAVREIDEVHHAEHQRQTARDQKQQDAELQAVEELDDDERDGHVLTDVIPAEREARAPGPRARGTGAREPGFRILRFAQFRDDSPYFSGQSAT